MPSGTDPNHPRFLLDESSFDFRRLDESTIETHLDGVSDCIHDLRSEGHRIAKFPDWHAILCLDDCELVDFLFPQERSGVNPDSLRRFVSLLDKCPEWDISTPGVPDTVRVGSDGAETFAPTLGFALFLQSSYWSVACLVFGSTLRRKQRRLAAEIGEAEVFFFAGKR